MKRLLTGLLGLLLLVAINAVAQDRTVTGKVTSAEDGIGLPGVNIVVKGTTRGTTTDTDGNYSIAVAQTDALVYSFVGFVSQTAEVGDRTSIDIVLEGEVETLEDVVVIGYGIVRKSDLTGSVSSVRGSDLTKVPAFNAMSSLQGKVAGVQIASSSGAPGARPVVNIRGVGTFGNSGPIYVVDGVMTENIDYLNPADIERMEVLKDASATSIYGSRGAQGVIMVTTRAGVKGASGPVIKFNAEYGVQTLQKKIDLLNGRQFAIVVNEIKPGSYNNVDAVPNTDWQDLLFQDAPIQSYQFSASGASERSQYYFGLGYFDQSGIIPKSSYKRLSLKINNTFELHRNVRLGNNIAITPYRQENANGNAPFVAYRAQPAIVPRQPDGSYSEVPGVGNLLADIEYTNSFERGVRSVSNFFVEVDFLEGFTFKSSVGIDGEIRKTKSFTPAFFVSPQQQNGTSDLNKGYGDRFSWLWENTINYYKDMGKHRIGAVVGYTMQESASENMSIAGESIIRPGEDFWYLNPDNVNGKSISNSVDINQNYSMISYLGRINYTYNDKYLLTATFRTDASSKFIRENRYSYFPAFAIGWNVINEPFLDGIEFLSNLKVRASWGIIGNEKIDYTRIYSPVLNGLGTVFGTNETVFPGSSYGVSGNPDLKWENTYQTDVGVELGFFNDQLIAEIGYYNKSTKDILIPLPVPGYLGNGEGATVVFNAAQVLNRGVEYDIHWQHEWNGIKYRIGTIGSTIHNEATKVFGSSEDSKPLFNATSTTATRPGKPIGAFYGYKTDGIFQNASELNSYPHLSNATVGDLRFVDTNRDGILNADDRTYLGSPIPTFIYGVNLEVGYKGFDLSVDFQGQTGNKIYNAKETVRPDLYNFEQHVFRRWTGEGTSNSEPKASQGGYNFQASSRFIQDGSFFRLRNVTLGYTLSENIASKVKMKTARVYISGTNVFTKTNFTGYTPELGATDPLNNRIDNSGYPVSSVYAAGLNVTF